MFYSITPLRLSYASIGEAYLTYCHGCHDRHTVYVVRLVTPKATGVCYIYIHH